MFPVRLLPLQVTSSIYLMGQLLLVHTDDWCRILSVFPSCLEIAAELKLKRIGYGCAKSHMVFQEAEI